LKSNRMSAFFNSLRRIYTSLNSTDILLIVFWGLLSIISLVFISRLPYWRLIILANLTACCLTCGIAYAACSTGSRVLRWIHDWDSFLLVVFTYKQVYYLIRPIHLNRDYDALLITIDRWIFGINPTQWLARFTNAGLTEVLQIAYSLFYVLFLAAGFELYRRSNSGHFSHFRFTVVYGFFLSYIGYFSLPAVGPRFTLHQFSNTDAELPGLLFTSALRWFVNFGESISTGASGSVALAQAQRDVFPSGHTMMTLVVVYFTFKYGLRIRYWILLIGSLLIFATVYLRYHYVIDILAGMLLAPICVFTSRRLSHINET
jgi:membrane-associated phospholipid phosphatase